MNRVSYTLDSTLESVNKAERTAVQAAAQAGFDEEGRENVGLAVREAAVNAMLHGNKYDPAKKVILAFTANSEKLVISIRDEGQGVDEAELPDPLAPENLLKQSGRGIFLIRSFMDEVQIRNMDPGTELTMIKYIKPVPHTEKGDSQAREE